MERNQFIKKVFEENVIKLTNNREYRVVKVNDENLDMSQELKDQLVVEGLYDKTYIGAVVPETLPKINMDYLPVYGSKYAYVTKHFKHTMELTIKADLSDRTLGLLKMVEEK